MVRPVDDYPRHGKEAEDSSKELVYNLLMSGFIAAATVGRQAAGKTLAISNSNFIVYKMVLYCSFKWKYK